MAREHLVHAITGVVVGVAMKILTLSAGLPVITYSASYGLTRIAIKTLSTYNLCSWEGKARRFFYAHPALRVSVLVLAVSIAPLWIKLASILALVAGIFAAIASREFDYQRRTKVASQPMIYI